MPLTKHNLKMRVKLTKRKQDSASRVTTAVPLLLYKVLGNCIFVPSNGGRKQLISECEKKAKSVTKWWISNMYCSMPLIQVNNFDPILKQPSFRDG
jgi:hypothetical protein